MPNKFIKYKDGSEYSGKVDDKGNRHDKGKLTLANGEKYVGEWKNDKKDGQGVYYNADGSILKRGFWRDDIFLKKSEYFKIKDQKKLREKFSNLLQGYRNQMDEAIYPYSETYGEDPEKHPFEDAPAELMDDEEYLLRCLEVDDGACFQFASERLKNKKEFVLKASDHYQFEDHISLMGDSLKKDLDIIIKTGLSEFGEFGDEILNDKNKLFKIIKKKSHKVFDDPSSLPDKIKSDKNFFLKLSKLKDAENTIKWANDEIQNDKTVIESYLKKSPAAIEHINKNNQNYTKYVSYAISKDGKLIDSVDKKFSKIKAYVLKAVKTYSNIFKSIRIDKKFRKDKEIVLTCLKKDPTMLKYVDEKFRKDRKIVLACLDKDPRMIKYAHKRFRKDKKLFLKLYKRRNSS